MKQAASNRAIRQMDATWNPLQQTEAVSQVVKQVVSRTEEQRLAKQVVRSATVPKTIPETVSKTTAVDQLTKAFVTFSVNLLQLV
jgi:uncharacterized protein YpbB